MLVGVSNFGEVMGQVSGLIAETTGFSSAAAAATAATAACTPPGNDADSVTATAQHGMTVANYISMLGMGLEQLAERAGETTSNNLTFQGLQIAGAAATSAI